MVLSGIYGLVGEFSKLPYQACSQYQSHTCWQVQQPCLAWSVLSSGPCRCHFMLKPDPAQSSAGVRWFPVRCVPWSSLARPVTTLSSAHKSIVLQSHRGKSKMHRICSQMQFSHVLVGALAQPNMAHPPVLTLVGRHCSLGQPGMPPTPVLCAPVGGRQCYLAHPTCPMWASALS